MKASQYNSNPMIHDIDCGGFHTTCDNCDRLIICIVDEMAKDNCDRCRQDIARAKFNKSKEIE